MTRAALLVLAGLGAGLLASAPAHAEDEYGGGSVIFARGSALYRTDPRGRDEKKLVELPGTPHVRALRTDARGQVLLADLDGTWYWMPLDGSATALTKLPCADGPAQLAVDGRCVLCRAHESPTGSVIYNLASGRSAAVSIPAPGARLVRENADRRLVWADAQGVWSAPPYAPAEKQLVAPQAPLRSLLPSPDGTRAVGVFLDSVYEGRTKTKPLEQLMSFALDGQGARRKGIKHGVPIEWSHDSQWVLVQDRGSACIMGARGGQYKCWKGFTGASLSPDGRWALLLGAREDKPSVDKKSASKGASKSSGKNGKSSNKNANKSSNKSAKPVKGEPEPSGEAENADDDGEVIDDVEVAPPSGPLSLFRAKLEGAFTERPTRIVGTIEGAAVWVPAAPPAAP